MSECIKTGCHVFLKQYGTYYRGDAFEMKVGGYSIYFFRLNNATRSNAPVEDRIHFVVQEIEHWFGGEGTGGVSTLIGRLTAYYGYDGKPSSTAAQELRSKS